MKMTGYIKKPHTAIFTGQTGWGKTHLVLELIEKEYKSVSTISFFFCPTLRENSTYHAKEWIQKMIKLAYRTQGQFLSMDSKVIRIFTIA